MTKDERFNRWARPNIAQRTEGSRVQSNGTTVNGTEYVKPAWQHYYRPFQQGLLCANRCFVFREPYHYYWRLRLQSFNERIMQLRNRSDLWYHLLGLSQTTAQISHAWMLHDGNIPVLSTISHTFLSSQMASVNTCQANARRNVLQRHVITLWVQSEFYHLII